MSKIKTEQRHLTHRGREFHFVSYEGQPGNVARQQTASGPSWFLMSAGKRWEVMPHDPAVELSELDRLLTAWLESHIFATTTEPARREEPFGRRGIGR